MGKLDVLLNLTGTVLSLALGVVLVWRSRVREFPLFFTYIASTVVIAIARLSLSGNYRLFFIFAWTTEALYAVLSLLVLYEVFHWVLFEFYRHWSWFWVLFPGLVVVMTSVSVWYALEYPAIQASRIFSLILVFGIAVNFVQVGIFLLFFFLVWVFGLRWWDYAFAIVLGFALSALSGLAAYWLRSEFGTSFGIFAKYAPPVAYILSVLLWLAVFIRPEPEPNWDVGIDRRRLLEAVRQYTRILARLREKLK